MRPGLEHENQVHTVQTSECRSKSSGDHNIPDLMICITWSARPLDQGFVVRFRI